MSPNRRLSWRRVPSLEDRFIERYAWLRGWALKLTGRNPDEADDLLHTAFVQFILRRPNLQDIQNVDAYLYRLLRNVRLSQVRRAARAPHAPLPLVDYDEAALALRTTNIHESLAARQELHGICEYACRRKESSKAGSVLLLRYFHGY